MVETPAPSLSASSSRAIVAHFLVVSFVASSMAPIEEDEREQHGEVPADNVLSDGAYQQPRAE
eukprot:3961758-Lingulodinium_polyedra.AAC.1